MARPINAIKERDAHIWTLRMISVGLFCLLVYAVAQVKTKAEDITVHYAPNVSAQKQGEVNNAYLYGLVFSVVSAINTWPNSGKEDYKKLINAYQCYMTDNYRSWLLKTLASKEQTISDISQIDELDRMRSVSEIEPYKDEKVRSLGNGVWVVWLDLRIKEHVKEAGRFSEREHKVKDVQIRYPFRVVWDGRDCNPTRLAIDGFYTVPERLGGA